MRVCNGSCSRVVSTLNSYFYPTSGISSTPSVSVLTHHPREIPGTNYEIQIMWSQTETENRVWHYSSSSVAKTITLFIIYVYTHLILSAGVNIYTEDNVAHVVPTNREVRFRAGFEP